MRRTPLLLLVALLAIAAVSVPVAYAATKNVSVRDNRFARKNITIAKGDTVRWSWAKADNPHNVKFTKVPKGAKKPRSCGTRDSGSCKRTLKKAGLYRYVCTIHVDSDGMRGSVRVTTP